MSEGQPSAGEAASAGPSAGTESAAPSASGIAPAFDWKQSGVSKEALDFAAGKGWKDPGAVIGSYQNLEKDYRQSVRIPGEDAKPEDVAKFWSRVGRPEKSDDYAVPKDYKAPEGGVDLVPWFKGVAHRHNLPAKAFEGVVGEFTQHLQELAQQDQEAYTAQMQQQLDAVVKAWGPQAAVHQRNIQLFRNAFGLSTDQTTEMMFAIGPEAWAKFAAKAGSYFAEAKIGGDLPGGGASFGLTKEAAQAKLDELSQDPAFAKRYAAEDKTAINEIARLRRTAAGT